MKSSHEPRIVSRRASLEVHALESLSDFEDGFLRWEESDVGGIEGRAHLSDWIVTHFRRGESNQNGKHQHRMIARECVRGDRAYQGTFQECLRGDQRRRKALDDDSRLDRGHWNF